MTHTITAIKARQNLGELLNCVSLKHDEFIIERGGKPMAAVIHVEKLQQLRAAARRHLGQLLEKTWAASKADLSAADLDALIGKARRAVGKKGRASR